MLECCLPGYLQQFEQSLNIFYFLALQIIIIIKSVLTLHSLCIETIIQISYKPSLCWIDDKK